MSEICGNVIRLVNMSYKRNHLLYGQGPHMPRWLRIVYRWMLIMLGSSYVSWLGFRAFADATRGDMGPALMSLGIGALAATIVTWALHRRKTRRRR